MGSARKDETSGSGSSAGRTLSFLLVIVLLAIVWIGIVRSLWGQ